MSLSSAVTNDVTLWPTSWPSHLCQFYRRVPAVLLCDYWGYRSSCVTGVVWPASHDESDVPDTGPRRRVSQTMLSGHRRVCVVPETRLQCLTICIRCPGIHMSGSWTFETGLGVLDANVLKHCWCLMIFINISLRWVWVSAIGLVLYRFYHSYYMFPIHFFKSSLSYKSSLCIVLIWFEIGNFWRHRVCVI